MRSINSWACRMASVAHRFQDELGPPVYPAFGEPLCCDISLSSSFSVAAFAQPPNPDAFYKLGPDSLPMDGVPKGEIRGPFKVDKQSLPRHLSHRDGFTSPPSTTRQPGLRLQSLNDGQAFTVNPNGDARAQNVIDNLYIPGRDSGHDRRVYQPGPHSRAAGAETSRSGVTGTTNRPTEYNTLDDKYARVIVDELMPLCL